MEQKISNLRKIGKISGIHGLRGEVFVHVFSKDVTWIQGLQELILENSSTHDRKIFHISSLRPHKTGFLVLLDGISDRTEAEKLRSQLVFVDGKLFETEEGDDSFYLSEIEGFQVFDSEIYIGTINGFGTNTVQDLLVVKYENGNIEIPLIEEFLVQIDFEQGKVFMKLPPGLIEVQKTSKKNDQKS